MDFFWRVIFFVERACIVRIFDTGSLLYNNVYRLYKDFEQDTPLLAVENYPESSSPQVSLIVSNRFVSVISVLILALCN